MPTVKNGSNLRDAQKRYLAGESVDKLAAELNIKPGTLRAQLIGIGTKFRTKTEEALLRSSLPRKAIVKLFIEGWSVLLLSKISGIGRAAVGTVLSEAGIETRSGSESMRLRWANATAEDKLAMLDAAHAAVRGRKVPVSELRKKSAAKNGKQPTSKIEIAFETMLISQGIEFSRQLAVDIYNLDFSIHAGPIAVELFGGGWHSGGHHLARFHKRVEHLLNAGFHVTVIWVDSRRHPLGPGCIGYLVKQIKRVSRHPPTTREYRVILGNGKPSPIIKSRFNTVADIKRLGSCCQFSHRDD